MSKSATAPAAHRIKPREGYGSGAFRRAIRMEADADGGRAELVDDFHHFAVRVEVREGEVVDIEGEDVRVPWTTCPGALEPLRAMIGAPLTRSLPALRAHTDARVQCTHLHDIACLAVAHVARVELGLAPQRRYDVTLPDRQAGAARAVLERDGAERLVWELERSRISRATPDDFAGVPLSGRPFQERLAAIEDPDEAEAVWVLQRAIFIGTGRRHDFESMRVATDFAEIVGGNCHSFAPERAARAFKIPGTVRDFTDRPGDLIRRD